jgi:hypothetical protein
MRHARIIVSTNRSAWSRVMDIMIAYFFLSTARPSPLTIGLTSHSASFRPSLYSTDVAAAAAVSGIGVSLPVFKSWISFLPPLDRCCCCCCCCCCFCCNIHPTADDDSVSPLPCLYFACCVSLVPTLPAAFFDNAPCLHCCTNRERLVGDFGCCCSCCMGCYIGSDGRTDGRKKNVARILFTPPFARRRRRRRQRQRRGIR